MKCAAIEKGSKLMPDDWIVQTADELLASGIDRSRLLERLRQLEGDDKRFIKFCESLSNPRDLACVYVGVIANEEKSGN
jgi:hypothetical protein